MKTQAEKRAYRAAEATRRADDEAARRERRREAVAAQIRISPIGRRDETDEQAAARRAEGKAANAEIVDDRRAALAATRAAEIKAATPVEREPAGARRQGKRATRKKNRADLRAAKIAAYRATISGK
jgi:hypothetical protein